MDPPLFDTAKKLLFLSGDSL